MWPLTLCQQPTATEHAQFTIFFGSKQALSALSGQLANGFFLKSLFDMHAKKIGTYLSQLFIPGTCRTIQKVDIVVVLLVHTYVQYVHHDETRVNIWWKHHSINV